MKLEITDKDQLYSIVSFADTDFNYTFLMKNTLSGDEFFSMLNVVVDDALHLYLERQ